LKQQPVEWEAEMANAQSLAGKWTYRSFFNDPVQVLADPNPPRKLRSLLFAEAVFTFEIPDDTTLKGAIDWTGGGLDLEGKISNRGGVVSVEITGNGRPGTDTADWEYDYHAELAFQWPNGVNQVPAIVGTVLRAKPHNGNPAGVTASFIAVRQT
jgi:hypothetical protein